MVEDLIVEDVVVKGNFPDLNSNKFIHSGPFTPNNECKVVKKVLNAKHLEKYVLKKQIASSKIIRSTVRFVLVKNTRCELSIPEIVYVNPQLVYSVTRQ